MADEVLLELRDDGVAVVSLNRPDKLNIYNLAMRDGLIEALSAVRDVPGVGALLLRANGPHFSAGADLAEFGTAETALEARRIRWDRDPWGILWDLPCRTRRGPRPPRSGARWPAAGGRRRPGRPVPRSAPRSGRPAWRGCRC